MRTLSLVGIIVIIGIIWVLVPTAQCLEFSRYQLRWVPVEFQMVLRSLSDRQANLVLSLKQMGSHPWVDMNAYTQFSGNYSYDRYHMGVSAYSSVPGIQQVSVERGTR